ncbi:hypothetical protein V6Z12_D01G242800 [Gossypium hirsutum]
MGSEGVVRANDVRGEESVPSRAVLGEAAGGGGLLAALKQRG